MTEGGAAVEPLVRLGVFVSVLIAMAAWELLAPRRHQAHGRTSRWPSNLGIVALDSLIVRVLFPAGAVGAALWAESQGLGLFRLLDAPFWAAVPLTVVLLDLAIWAQHRVFHAVPALWRLHRMHHTDLEFDVTTGLRFHPVEIVLSMVIKIAVVIALGAPALGVLVFEVLLNACSMFSHGNVRLPGWIDQALRRVIVTPDMHRVHHSVIREETDSNFGFCLSVWDRWFGTYRAEPAAGQLGFTIGIETFRDPAELRLDRLLTQPFRADKARTDKPQDDKPRVLPAE
ncbi:sterol desaturase family protein [Elioraea rosea]|uniref:sterol desaturase family protein n=1 Tax=Elioraea rosea TaxID=2492390 RepID=UPI0011843D0D|nr:sterol desaturase family protein [Elioraea rosea]